MGVSLYYSRTQAEEARKNAGEEAIGYTEALVATPEGSLEITRYTHQGEDAPAYEDAYVVAQDVDVQTIEIIRNADGKYTREGGRLRNFLAQEGYDLEADAPER